MARRDARAPHAKALTKAARRDVRWACLIEPGEHVHAVDVHGVHIVYRRAPEVVRSHWRQHAKHVVGNAY